MEERTSDATPPANITHADWQATPLPVRQLVGRLLDLARQALTDAWNAGMWHLEREHYDGAHVSLTRALDTARALGDQALEVWLLAHLSQVEVGRGHVAPAEEKARKALEVAGAVGDDKLRALALNSLGVALLHGGKSGVPAAVDHLRRAVDLARASRGPVLPEAMINLANALLHRGNLTEAAEWLDQVETGASDQISEELRVLCQINRATLAGLRGERWEAERHARAAVQECAGREDRTHWMALVTLALCLVELGDELEARGKGDPQGTFKDAETNFVAAAELAGRLHHRQGVWVARLNQAMLLSRMARYEEARQMILEQVLPLVVEHRDHRSEAFCHLNLGDIHLAALARQVGLDPQSEGLPGRGFAPLGPVRVFDKAIRRGPRQPGGSTEADPLSRQRDGLDEAMAWYRKARRLLARVGDDEGLRVVYSRLGDLYARLPGKTRRAAACYRLAISRWERARELLTGDMLRLSFLGRGLDPYHGLLALYIREGHKTAAFIAAEQARARSLVEAVTRIVGLPGGATLDAPPPETRADQAAYAELRDPPPTTVASLRAFLAATEDELAQLPRPGDYRSTPRRAILASYAVSPGAIHLFVLRSDMEEPELFSEPLDDNLRRFVRTNFGSARRVSSLLHGSSVRLWYDYNWLIAPLATYAAPGDLIYLAPSGILRDVPLHTLHLAGMPLGLRNTVVYVPAAGLLTACRARRCTAPDGAPLRARVAVFGDAQNNLAHARDEAETLARMFGIAPVLGAAVTAETIGEALQSCDLVHISGHGAFGGTDAGEQTALLLANGQVFSAQDVLALPPLPTQLVTLGGCETGVSDERPGDEQIGLHRALLIAGVRAMLLSLWSVGDPSAAFLMKQLYRYLGASEGWCLADALHLAMHDTSKQKDWSAFYHWAPFVLIGDWR